MQVIALGCTAALATSCEDFLEKQPLDSISSVQVFQDPALTESYLYTAYDYMPMGHTNSEGKNVTAGSSYGWAHTYSELADNSRSKSGWVVSNKIYNSGVMTASAGICDGWSACYSAIRKCNVILGGLEDATYDEALVKRYSAEARVIRAFMYWDLARRYGDVPLIKAAQTPSEDLQTPQTPQAEVYAFAAAELGEAAADLPLAKDLRGDEYGRFTREAAWAYQGQTLLYAKEWAESAAASLKVITSESAFSLDPDYGNVFRGKGATKNPEVIFEIMFDLANKYHGAENYGASPADGGSGFANPTQDLVDQYETLNGLLPENDPQFDPMNPYANRDKRLAATIQYHGMEHRGRITDHSCTISESGDLVAVGVDAPLKTGAHTITGYYIRKGNLDDAVVPRYSDVNWVDMRLGEVYLNYVEAVNQDGGDMSEVYKYMDLIRERAGLPALSTVRPALSKDEMIEVILRERRVELAFEKNRLWDLIRYDRAVETLNGYQAHGMRPIVDANGKLLRYETYNVAGPGNPQIFPEYYMLFPIPQGEMDKNANLVQNPGY